MSLMRSKPEKKGSVALAGSGVNGPLGVGVEGGPSTQTQGNARRRNSDFMAGHAVPLETFKLPSWHVPPLVYKNKHHSTARQRKQYVQSVRCFRGLGMLIYRIGLRRQIRNGGTIRRLQQPSPRRTSPLLHVLQPNPFLLIDHQIRSALPAACETSCTDLPPPRWVAPILEITRSLSRLPCPLKSGC
jgi:hypothetical protein